MQGRPSRKSLAKCGGADGLFRASPLQVGLSSHSSPIILHPSLSIHKATFSIEPINKKGLGKSFVGFNHSCNPFFSTFHFFSPPARVSTSRSRGFAFSRPTHSLSHSYNQGLDSKSRTPLLAQTTRHCRPATSEPRSLATVGLLIATLTLTLLPRPGSLLSFSLLLPSFPPLPPDSSFPKQTTRN